MSEHIPGFLDPTRLLFELQKGNAIAQSFSGCLDPETIAHRVTEGLVVNFDCALARIWIVEPDRTTLKLVASSGMYTHTDGFFSRVPMGAFKVGKIAQNRVSFLSNNLADEPWVKDRQWAVANNIRGFAGYPLMANDRVIGVLATFSHQAMVPEFLEVLQNLCTTVTVALENALQHQQEKKAWQSSVFHLPFHHLSLSDRIAKILNSARLTLIGTEQPLTLSLDYLFLQLAERLNTMGCNYCRLIYSGESVAMEAIVATPNMSFQQQCDWVRSTLGELFFTASCLEGVLQTHTGANHKVIQILLKIPYPSCSLGNSLRIKCSLPVLQMAFTHIAYFAGLIVCDSQDEAIPLLTDEVAEIATAKRVLWIEKGTESTPKGIHAQVDLSISSAQLREAVETVMRGEFWGIESETTPALLSDRERKIMSLMAQGLRDRDIANQLFISESTVKFHINNTLAKLQVKNRYQALYQLIVKGFIQ